MMPTITVFLSANLSTTGSSSSISPPASPTPLTPPLFGRQINQQAVPLLRSPLGPLERHERELCPRPAELHVVRGGDDAGGHGERRTRCPGLGRASPLR